jgi:hypothetical protein
MAVDRARQMRPSPAGVGQVPAPTGTAGGERGRSGAPLIAAPFPPRATACGSGRGGAPTQPKRPVTYASVRGCRGWLKICSVTPCSMSRPGSPSFSMVKKAV